MVALERKAVDRQGYLFTPKKKGMGWKRRWVRLQGTTFSVFLDELADVPKQVLDIGAYSLRTAPPGTRRRVGDVELAVFRMQQGLGGEPIDWGAASDTDRDDWLAALTRSQEAAEERVAHAARRRGASVLEVAADDGSAAHGGTLEMMSFLRVGATIVRVGAGLGVELPVEASHAAWLNVEKRGTGAKLLGRGLGARAAWKRRFVRLRQLKLEIAHHETAPADAVIHINLDCRVNLVQEDSGSGSKARFSVRSSQGDIVMFGCDDEADRQRWTLALMVACEYTYDVQQARIGAARDELQRAAAKLSDCVTTATAGKTRADSTAAQKQAQDVLRRAELKLQMLTSSSRPRPVLGGGIHSVDESFASSEMMAQLAKRLRDGGETAVARFLKKDGLKKLCAAIQRCSYRGRAILQEEHRRGRMLKPVSGATAEAHYARQRASSVVDEYIYVEDEMRSLNGALLCFMTIMNTMSGMEAVIKDAPALLGVFVFNKQQVVPTVDNDTNLGVNIRGKFTYQREFLSLADRERASLAGLIAVAFDCSAGAPGSEATVAAQAAATHHQSVLRHVADMLTAIAMYSQNGLRLVCSTLQIIEEEKDKCRDAIRVLQQPGSGSAPNPDAQDAVAGKHAVLAHMLAARSGAKMSESAHMPVSGSNSDKNQRAKTQRFTRLVQLLDVRTVTMAAQDPLPVRAFVSLVGLVTALTCAPRSRAERMRMRAELESAGSESALEGLREWAEEMVDHFQVDLSQHTSQSTSPTASRAIVLHSRSKKVSAGKLDASVTETGSNKVLSVISERSRGQSIGDHQGVVTTVQQQKRLEALDEVGVLLDMLDDYESFAQDDEEAEQQEFEWNDIEAVLRRLDRALLVASSSKAAAHANITAHLGNIVVDLETNDGERFGEFTAQYELDTAASHVQRPVLGLMSSQSEETARMPTVGAADVSGTMVASEPESKTVKKESSNPKFVKYEGMRKAGVSEGAIRQRMALDGLSVADADVFFDDSGGNVAPAAAFSGTGDSVEKSNIVAAAKDSKLAKYANMHTAGLLHRALRQRMARDPVAD
eukprot:g365.t1